MRLRERGQVLPFCVMLMTILLGIVFSNFEIGFSQYKKIEHQKQLDATALRLSTQYAQGLNAIAALNEGLVLISNRVVFVDTVYAALGACAALMIVCEEPFRKLSNELPTFHKRLLRLGRNMAADQDRIREWMVTTQCETLLKARQSFEQIYVYPSLSCESGSRSNAFPWVRSSPVTIHGLPGPLTFKPEFWTEKNKILILAGISIRSPFTEHHILETGASKIWGLSEAIVRGSNIQKMEFYPELHAVSLQKKLWDAHGSVSSQLPPLKEFEYALAH